MQLGRLVTTWMALGLVAGLSMCGSDDSKKRVTAEGGEAGAEPGIAGAPSSGGAQNPTPQGGASGTPDEMPGGGVGTDLAGNGSGGIIGLPPGGESTGGAPLGAAGADTGMGGTPAFCAVDSTSCCQEGEPSCGTWPGSCGQDMNSYSCCGAGVRLTCEVEYVPSEANYRVVYGKELCECGAGSCDCACVKGDSCPYQEADCTRTSWHDSCFQGSSPSCCDASTGMREKCVFAPGIGKTFTRSVIIDQCTGEGFGTQACDTCLGAQDPPCDEAFEASCSDAVSYCSNTTVGYRMTCQSGTVDAVCTCDPSVPISG
jgi:hypothetical protein